MDNWQRIKEETKDLIGRDFQDAQGLVWKLSGIVDGEDDYYYLLWNYRFQQFQLWSCVGNLDSYRLTLYQSKWESNIENDC